MTVFYRTASFRLTAWYVTLLAAGFCFVLSVAYVTLTAALREQFKVDVLEELDSMTARASRSSIEATTREIVERTQSSEGLGLHYLMQSADGTRLAGDLRDIARSESWQERELGDVSIMPVSLDDDDDQQVWGQGRILEDGRFLFVGQDADRILGTQETILNIFMWSSVLALVLSVILGIMIARGFLKRINAINRTSQLIMAGKLKARIPVGYRQDEIDQLSINLNRLFDSNQALLDSLKSATTNIAHDLRTPLSRLRQGLERARSGEEDVALYGAAIDTAIADTEQILRTFAALLRISQIGSGSRKSAFQPTNLSDIVGRLIAAYAPVAEDQKKTLAGDIQDNVMLDGDGELLLQAAANLVENAIKHTPENARIDIRLVNEGETVHLSVADTGPGIPADMREKVLERFFRLEGSRSTPGSGLGLTLVHAVAELHGAKLVLADNHPGLMATLILPVGVEKKR